MGQIRAVATVKSPHVATMVVCSSAIRPLDRAAINAFVRKTNRMVTVEEGFPQHGVGTEIWSVSLPLSVSIVSAPCNGLKCVSFAA
jgi:pyruvate dehydrogenase E1 component beta subunit